jgi:hypothetical protein
MTPTAAPIRPRQVTNAANACAAAALALLIFTARWILLSLYSPNFASAPRPPAIRSLGLSLVIFLLSAMGLTAWYMLLKLHRYALLSFEVFWLSLVGCASFAYIFLRRTHDFRGVVFICVFILAGAFFWRSLKLNLPR